MDHSWGTQRDAFRGLNVTCNGPFAHHRPGRDLGRDHGFSPHQQPAVGVNFTIQRPVDPHGTGKGRSGKGGPRFAQQLDAHGRADAREGFAGQDGGAFVQRILELSTGDEPRLVRAVVEVVRRHFSPETPEAVVNSVSGFGGGSGSGCICGAISGGTVALGLVLGDKKLTTHLTRELHGWFKEKYGVTCCKTIRQTHKDKETCPVLTGEVAGKIAEMLSRK